MRTKEEIRAYRRAWEKKQRQEHPERVRARDRERSKNGKRIAWWREYNNRRREKKNEIALKSYYRHKESRVRGIVMSLRQRRAALNAMKADVGCHVCGEKDFRCLDWHHREPNEKAFNISNSMGKVWEVMLAEIAKCDVTCANCHRKITYEAVVAKRKYKDR